MFDYQTSKHAYFDAACRAFALAHNLEDVAAAVGMRPQILRNKLNPVQSHRLICDELLAITDYTEDARLMDGILRQINCLPSVPVTTSPVQRQRHEITEEVTKTALHRTRLRFLDHKIFSVLFFFKSDRQTAPVLAALRKTRTEKIEKNFSFFQLQGS